MVIAACFTPELQGFYYAFSSLMAIQTLVELGLHGVVINVSSHEWATLRLDTDAGIVGDPNAIQRLAELKRFVTRWYSGVALIFFVGCGAIGGVVLSQRPAEGIAWVAPWVCLVALNSLLLWAWAYSAMLEGCNQVSVVNRVRLLQSVTGSLVVWVSMALGLGLWSTIASVAVRLTWDYWLIFLHYGRFWRSLDAQPSQGTFSWRHEIWPLQWKTAATGVAGFFATSLFVPVMLTYHGLVVCGQTGMTLGILTAIESAAYSWVYVRSPQFGMLAARRDWPEMDRIFYRLTAISSCIFFLGLVAVCGGVWVLNHSHVTILHRLASRMLGLEPTIVFGCAYLLFHFPRCQSIYVRAHKRDPFLLSGIVTNVLTAFAVLSLGRWYGPLGAAWGYLAVVATVNVPWTYWIWSRSRREWHRPEPIPE